MEAEDVHHGNERSLRVVLPDLYSIITSELEKQYNIHPYDIQITVSEEEKGYTLYFYFGEGYNHKEEHSFSHTAVKELGNEVANFVDGFGESCKQAMIADYYKMLKM